MLYVSYIDKNLDDFMGNWRLFETKIQVLSVKSCVGFRTQMIIKQHTKWFDLICSIGRSLTNATNCDLQFVISRLRNKLEQFKLLLLKIRNLMLVNVNESQFNNYNSSL